MRFDTIVAPTDLDASSDPGIQVAADIVRRYGKRLVLVAVAGGSDVDVGHAGHQAHAARAELETKMQSKLDQIVAELGEGIDVETHLRFGDMVTELLAAVHVAQADAVVITVKNRSRLGKLLMGSKAQEIILRSDVPVLTIPRS